MATALQGYDLTSFSHDGATRHVYRRGDGPAVVVMAEMPGITPKVVGFADRLVDEGFTAYLPHLFGQPGVAPSGAAYARAIAPGCVSREFAAFAKGRTEPVSNWLRALGRHALAERGGLGIGAVGMCFTGGFALGMMVDDALLAPVLSQPSLPLNLTARHKADLHLSPDDLTRVKARAAGGVCVLGLRFTADALSPAERFETLRRELGDAFIGVEIDSSPGNRWGIRKRAHSVLTEDLVTDDPEHPTAKALAQVIEFLRERLRPA